MADSYALPLGTPQRPLLPPCGCRPPSLFLHAGWGEGQKGNAPLSMTCGSFAVCPLSPPYPLLDAVCPVAQPLPAASCCACLSYGNHRRPRFAGRRGARRAACTPRVAAHPLVFPCRPHYHARQGSGYTPFQLPLSSRPSILRPCHLPDLFPPLLATAFITSALPPSHPPSPPSHAPIRPARPPFLRPPPPPCTNPLVRSGRAAGGPRGVWSGGCGQGRGGLSAHHHLSPTLAAPRMETANNAGR